MYTCSHTRMYVFYYRKISRNIFTLCMERQKPLGIRFLFLLPLAGCQYLHTKYQKIGQEIWLSENNPIKHMYVNQKLCKFTYNGII